MLRTVKTKFGTFFIEDLNSVREESDIIKIFDSNKKYMDYISVAHLNADRDYTGRRLEEEYQLRINDFIDCDTIESLIEKISFDYEMVTSDWEEVADYLGINYYPNKQLVLNELNGNEYVNRIGDYFIVLSPY